MELIKVSEEEKNIENYIPEKKSVSMGFKSTVVISRENLRL